MIITLVIIEVLAAALIAAYRWIFLSTWDAATISTRTGVALAPADAAPTLARWRNVANQTSLFAFIGSVIGAITTFAISADGYLEPPALPLAGMIVGATLGLSSWLVSEARRREASEGLAERPQGVVSTDYLSRPVRYFAASSLAAVVVIVILGAVALGSSGTRDGFVPQVIPIAPLLPLIALAASMLIFFATLVVITKRRQVARDTLALAWDDAITAQLLVIGIAQLSVAPIYLTLFAYSAGLGSTGDLAARTIALVTVSVFVLAGAIMVAVFDRKPERQFLRRLWPQTAVEADRLAAEHKRAKREARAAAGLRHG